VPQVDIVMTWAMKQRRKNLLLLKNRKFQTNEALDVGKQL